jgi:hypothetical protein
VLLIPALRCDDHSVNTTQGDSRFNERRIGLDYTPFDVGDEDTLKQWHAHLER